MQPVATEPTTPGDSQAPAVEDDLSVNEAMGPFWLRNPVEIAFVLRDLARSGALIKVCEAGDVADALITSLISVDVQRGEVQFEAGRNTHLARRLAAARELAFYAAQDKIRIHFVSGQVRTIRVDGEDAFMVPLPGALLRLQRREYFRVAIPLSTPVECVIPIADDPEVRQVGARAQDLSLGGVGLLVEPNAMALETGAEYPNCRIMLPGTGNVVTTLAIRHVTSVSLPNDRTVSRYGCAFVRPSTSATTLLQRYLQKLERELRLRE